MLLDIPAALLGKALSESEAQTRLKEEGYNELPSTKKRSIFAIAWDVIREPMFLLLVACGSVYLILGDKQEAFLLLGFVFVVMGITLYQERKTERALEALRDLSSPRALVIRDGAQKRIPGREVARGDLFVVYEGDRVPADGRVLSTLHLSVDESLLTGESVPVLKNEWNGKTQSEATGGSDLPFIFSSTLVVQGKAICQATATGIHTEIGKIGKSLEQLIDEDTSIKKETMRIVKVITILGAILCTSVILLFGFLHGRWLEGVLAGISLAMALLPEEFPVVLTIFLALGAWRISKKNVLTRRVPAVEMLGSTTVLCSDKTGTLTQNRMSLSRLIVGTDTLEIVENETEAFPERFHALLEYSILASHRDPFDPMEKAFLKLGKRFLAGTEHLHEHWSLLKEYPLSQELTAMSQAWESEKKNICVVAAKGSPEAIVDLCHLSSQEKDAILAQVHTFAAEGFRVLAAASATFPRGQLPDIQHDFDFRFLGLLCLSDPIRPAVPAAVAECTAAGIRTVMITGDHPNTAEAIARQIGLFTEGGKIITGPELRKMNDEDLRRRIGNTRIFARILPEQKLRIVEALKANGEIVAMTGDGVNDAPALKAAHIGVAMGGRGTDVAREASDLVLLDDDFSSIVSAVRLGRRIFDNLQKAMAYIIAIHVPIAGLSFLPVLFNWPLILSPVHIVFLELIIDPACSVVFEMEPEERGIMRRPPRNPKVPMFGRKRMFLSILQGLSVLSILLIVFLVSRLRGESVAESRALTFMALVMANMGLILTNRSWSRTIIESFSSFNSSVYWMIGGVAVFLSAVLLSPFLRDLFSFAPVSLFDVLVALLAGLVGISWFEMLKVVARRNRHELLGV
jgi:Ca2+-transporting ATPase